MAESTPSLQQAVNELNRRMARLEQRLAMPPLPPLAAAPSPIAGEPMPEYLLAEPPPSPPPPSNVLDLRPLVERKREMQERQPSVQLPPQVARVPQPISAPLPRQFPPVAPVSRPPTKARTAPAPVDQTQKVFGVEGVIGAKWFAAAGAIVVVIGVGLFLKMAYDRGWLDRIPPVGKVLSGAAFGFALLGAGEVARRKINAVASAGLSAAGIGVLYASAFASHAVYHLVSPVAAFFMLAGAAILGIAVAARARLVSVALLSLVGGYLVPVIINDTSGSPAIVPAYLLALQAIGLGLSGWRPDPFHVLRRPAWWGTAILGTLWVFGYGFEHASAALPFLALFWAGVHAELVFASRRGGMIPGEQLQPGFRLSWRAARPIMASFSTTALSVGLAAAVLTRGTALPDWLSPATGALFTVVLAFGLARNLRVLRDLPRNDSERIGAALAMQAGALVIATVALAFQGGWAQVAAWLALGVAAVAAGRWIRSRGLDVYGLVVLCLAASRLMLLDWWATPLAENGVFWAGLYLTRWTVLVALCGAGWTAASLLLRRDGRFGEIAWRNIARVVLAVGLTFSFVSLLHRHARFESAETVLVALAVTLAAVGAGLRSRGMAVYGIAVLGLASAMAGIARLHGGIGGSFAAGEAFAGLVLNELTFVMALCGAAWLLVTRLMTNPRLGRTDDKNADLLLDWLSGSRIVLAVGLTFLFASLMQQGARFESAATVLILLGATGAGIGAMLRSRGLLLFGVAGLVLASGWALLTGAQLPFGLQPDAAEGLQVAGLVLTRWTYVMVVAGIAWLAAARLTLVGNPAGERQWRLVAIACAATGVASAAFSLLHLHAEAASICIAWLVLGVAATLSHRIQPRLALDGIGLSVVLTSIAPWAVAYPLGGWFDSGAPIGLHPGLWLAIAIIGVGLGLAHWLLRLKAVTPTSPPRTTLHLMQVVAVSLLWLASSFEASRFGGVVSDDRAARLAALSMWWGLFAVGLIALGFVRRVPAVRYAGLALMSVATAKAAIFDLAGVSQEWRVVSFVGLGLLMLGVAVAYSRIAARLEADARTGGVLKS